MKPEARRLTEEALSREIIKVPEWRVVKTEGVPCLQRAFVFKNFVTALDFANKVGALAEEHNHHPALLVEWGRVMVTWWTHSINGLQEKDIIMAQQTSRIFNAM